MFCSNCGKEIVGNENFCPNCGKSPSGNTDLPANQGVPPMASAEPPRIEIHRKSAWYGILNDFKVYVDGSEIGRVGNGKAKTFTVTPGEHKLKVKITWWWDHSPEVAFTAANNTLSKFQCRFTFGLLGTLFGWGGLKSLFTGGNVIRLENVGN